MTCRIDHDTGTDECVIIIIDKVMPEFIVESKKVTRRSSAVAVDAYKEVWLLFRDAFSYHGLYALQP